ncbi:YlbG family protein [Lactococcus termiticola]|uniref:Uncharacterized protein n=1 Tax=Lactococcus termiticola TaxID=2169526 RepID=A0A2R5HDA9_9LACT|nr:YlbG family protein [Lactococcus termiticola]GBG96059.1 hypothetical protein NtB2_00162 [Lactococcus termiticola]
MPDTDMELNILDNKEKIKALEGKERLAVYVFCHNYRSIRQLSKYGELLYSSQKAKYGLLYIDKKDLDENLEKLRGLKAVRKVRVSQMDKLSDNFSEAFEQTNQAVKEEMAEMGLLDEA